MRRTVTRREASCQIPPWGISGTQCPAILSQVAAVKSALDQAAPGVARREEKTHELMLALGRLAC